MRTSDILNQAADALEKTAEFIEKTESARITAYNVERLKVAQTLADKIAETTGEPLEEDLVEKLSAMGSDVQNILGRLTDGGTVDSLGDAETTTKLASVEGGLPAEDARFISWVQS